MKPTRYQDSPWWVRLWRRRHYLPIPFRTFGMWLYEQSRDLEDEEFDWRMGWSDCWSLNTALAQCYMHWYYTSDELRVKLNIKPEDMPDASNSDLPASEESGI